MDAVIPVIIDSAIKHAMFAFKHPFDRRGQNAVHPGSEPRLDRIQIRADQDSYRALRQQVKLVRFRNHIDDIAAADSACQLLPVSRGRFS